MWFGPDTGVHRVCSRSYHDHTRQGERRRAEAFAGPMRIQKRSAKPVCAPRGAKHRHARLRVCTAAARSSRIPIPLVGGETRLRPNIVRPLRRGAARGRIRARGCECAQGAGYSVSHTLDKQEGSGPLTLHKSDFRVRRVGCGEDSIGTACGLDTPWVHWTAQRACASS